MWFLGTGSVFLAITERPFLLIYMEFLKFCIAPDLRLICYARHEIPSNLLISKIQANFSLHFSYRDEGIVLPPACPDKLVMARGSLRH